MEGQQLVDTLKTLVSSSTQLSTPFAPVNGVGVRRWTDSNPPTWTATVKPANVQDLQAVVKYATEKGVPFLAVSSGHGYSSYSKAKNVLQIDLNNFKEIQIDEANYTVRLGGAVLHKEAIEPLWKAQRQIRKGSG